MALFIECLLWWMLAVAGILRWFHVFSQEVDAEDENWPVAASRYEAPDGAVSES